MGLIEYLVVDRRRLDAYVEQIGPPVTYDKVPVWTAELGMLGPKTETTQTRHGRPLTQHEKVQLLLGHLAKEGKGALARSRPFEIAWVRPYEDGTRPPVFVLETCTAMRIHIRPGPGVAETHSLYMWLSAAPEGQEDARAGMLSLLEDFPHSDDDPRNCYGNSAFSLLLSLVTDLHDRIGQTILGARIPRSRYETGQQDSDAVPAFSSDLKCFQVFARDPLPTLRRLGCLIGPERRIRVLYRIREFGIADWTRSKRCDIFGYPIVITAADASGTE